MSLSYIILLLLSVLVLISLLLLLKSHSFTKNSKTQLDNQQKNNLYKYTLIKEVQESIKYGKNLESVIDTLINSLEKTLPYSTLSSIFIKEQKLVFRSQIKESVNHAFVENIKNNMLNLITDREILQDSIEENISGLSLEDLSSSSILSTFDIKIIIKNKVSAVINLSSTKPSLYNAEAMKDLTFISEFISRMLTNIESFLDIEKSKTLSMIDSFSEGIFMIDTNQKLIAMNDSAENFLNIHKKMPVTGDVLLALPNIYNFKEKLSNVIAEKKQIIEEDVTIDSKIFKITLSPVLEINNPQNLIGASVLLRDTTREKSFSQMKVDFTNIMVHELRSPLTAIKASSQFLMSDASLTDEEKQKLTGMISESSKKMLDEIALILDSAKMDAGLFTIRKVRSDINKLITDRVAVFKPLADEKAIKVDAEIDPSITPFSFDPIRIDEVINNLLSNSLKFTPQNGSISIKARFSDGMVNVSVTDTGQGVPKEKQHLLFTKFQQAPAGGSHVGTGLGLYVVKGVVEAHGGKVWLESEEGKGATISFTLPIVDAVQTASAESSPATPQNPMVN